MNRAILAIDPATHTGWALRLENGQKFHGAWNLGDGHHRERLQSLFKKLAGLMNEHSLREYDLFVVFEKAKFTKHPGSQALATKLEAMIDIFTVTYGFRIPKPVTVQEWRSFFLKDNGFLTKIKPPEGTKDTTAWYKAKVIEKCRAIGIQPENDNEADAIGILFWATFDGLERQKVRKQRQQDIKAQKKAQGDLLECAV